MRRLAAGAGVLVGVGVVAAIALVRSGADDGFDDPTGPTTSEHAIESRSFALFYDVRTSRLADVLRLGLPPPEADD